MSIEDRLHEIREEMISLYPEAVRIDVSITEEEIEAIPRYRTDVSGYAMRNVKGGWVKKLDEREESK
jgi:hypothetical protein